MSWWAASLLIWIYLCGYGASLAFAEDSMPSAPSFKLALANTIWPLVWSYAIVAEFLGLLRADPNHKDRR